jgi:hypothetical protein
VSNHPTIQQYWKATFEQRLHMPQPEMDYHIVEIDKGAMAAFNRWTTQYAPIYHADSDLWLTPKAYWDLMEAILYFHQDEGYTRLKLESQGESPYGDYRFPEEAIYE